MKLTHIALILCAAVITIYLFKKYRIPPAIAFPELALTDLSGNAVSLQDFQGKHIFLNFYATWCAPCRKEMPDLINASKKLTADDVLFIAVSDEDVGKIKRFKGNAETPIVFLRMEGKREDINVFTIPTSYLIAENGKVVYEKVGVEDWDSETMLQRLRGLIANN